MVGQAVNIRDELLDFRLLYDVQVPKCRVGYEVRLDGVQGEWK